MLAVAGTNWRLYERDSRGYEVQNWIYHEKYSKSSGGDYDIGLIRLDKRIELSPETKPIALDTTDSTSVGDEVVLLGFGKTKVSKAFLSMEPRNFCKLIIGFSSPTALRTPYC